MVKVRLLVNEEIRTSLISQKKRIRQVREENKYKSPRKER